MLDFIRTALFPLAEIVKALGLIAAELKIIRELYETELMTRNPPVYRITEDADPNNVEVCYPTFEGDPTETKVNAKMWNRHGSYSDIDD